MDIMEAFIEALLIKKAEEGPRGTAEANLVRAFDKLHKRMNDKILSHSFTDKLINEQLEEFTAYLETMLTDFNTFIEQFESTITAPSGNEAEKNPHSSGN